ncbi:MAG: hypothetical protein M0R06_23410 [Sphaerochaeta sp.]|jgi:hypothetical protein|nr:hypothetical protein [Sphaerochaeta sp.]
MEFENLPEPAYTRAGNYKMESKGQQIGALVSALRSCLTSARMAEGRLADDVASSALFALRALETQLEPEPGTGCVQRVPGQCRIGLGTASPGLGCGL